MFDYIGQPHILGMILLWALTAIPTYLGYAYYIQLKEYRWDRGFDFLRTYQGHRFMLEYHFFARIVIGLALYTVLRDLLHPHSIFLLILLLDLLATIIHVRRVGIRRPKPTKKAQLIVASSLLIEGMLVYAVHFMELLIVLLLARFIIITTVTVFFSLPTNLFKKYYIARARKKIASYSGLTVVGITGSYGKSSVKEFLSHILATKFRVINTPRNTNTEIGVAKFILRTDFSNTDYFVCEMGAYRIGEIQAICDIVRPRVGILTAINQQHLSLFGSIKQTQQAKYELIRAIPKDGYVITNADNPYCTELLDELECETVHTFGAEEEHTPHCLITDIDASLSGTSFEGSCDGSSTTFTTPVIGAHHAFNIAPAVMAARHAGMDQSDVIAACKTLPTDVHGSLQVYKAGKAHIIDDSYNSNPKGFRSALDVLGFIPSDKRRVVITRGMLELGSKSEEEHEKIGEEIAFAADELVIISPNDAQALETGVGAKYHTDVRRIFNAQELYAYVGDLLAKDVAVLLENRLPGIVYALIQEQRKK